MAFDAFSGGTSAEQTTQTVSGSGRGVSGKKNQYTESGAISVGQSGQYAESGALVLSGKGAKNLAKGSKDLSGNKGTITVTESNQGFSADDVATVLGAFTGGTGSTISAGGAGAAVAFNPSDPNSSTTQQPTTSTTDDAGNGFLAKIKAFWSGMPVWQKTAAGLALVLILFLIFKRRRG